MIPVDTLQGRRADLKISCLPWVLLLTLLTVVLPARLHAEQPAEFSSIVKKQLQNLR